MVLTRHPDLSGGPRGAARPGGGKWWATALVEGAVAGGAEGLGAVELTVRTGPNEPMGSARQTLEGRGIAPERGRATADGEWGWAGLSEMGVAVAVALTGECGRLPYSGRGGERGVRLRGGARRAAYGGVVTEPRRVGFGRWPV